MKLFAVGLIALFAVCGGASGVYVDKDNTAGPWNGTSWKTAYRTIQEGVDAAAALSGTPREVWVAAGVYSEARRITDGALAIPGTVAVYGGFAGSESARDQRDWKQWATVIDGSAARGGLPAYHVVVMASQAVLDGFTVRGGYACGNASDFAYGGGLATAGTSVSVANCTFTANRALTGGGAFYFGGGSQMVSDCTFSSNSVISAVARVYGGAGFVQTGTQSSFMRCAFTGNSAASTFGDADGGALYLLNSSPSIKQCRFIQNAVHGLQSARGGGIVNTGDTNPSHPPIENSVFRGNRVEAGTEASYGGAIYNGLGTNPTLINCTFSGNVAPDGGGMATYSYNSTPLALNCIFWDNSGGEIRTLGTSAATFTCCDVQGGVSGQGNLDQDPQFVSASTGDLGLKSTSPCLDKGTAFLAPANDILGAVRPNGAGIDMGAYEYPSRETPPIWYVDNACAGSVHDGQSWATAFTTIQAGINQAFNTGGGRVYVAEGVYNEARTTTTGSLELRAGVAVYGGFPNAAAIAAFELNEREPLVHTTTIDGATARGGAPAYHVVIGANDALLDGFVVTGGNANGTDNVTYTMRGGGLLCNGVSPTVRSCLFKGNAADYGGAVCLFSSSSAFEKCVFNGNTARVDGAGIWDGSSSAPAFINCVFGWNTASRYGGALFNYTESAPLLMNCTIYGNTGSSGGGAMSTWCGSCTPIVVNSILWNNQPGEIHTSGGGSVQVSRSDVRGGYTGDNNINVAPGFMNPTLGNLQLLPTSPCIDKGTDVGAPNRDLVGTPRPQGAGMDMGAYESFSASEGPVKARLSMADDRVTLYVNGTQIIQTEWGYLGGVYDGHHVGDSGFVDITNYLQRGQNQIRMTVWNAAICCGVSGFLDLSVAGRTIYHNGISGTDSSEGIKFDDTYVLNWSGPDGHPTSNDLDGDLMPDVWETAHGLNPMDPSDATADADGDGLSNRDEYLRGSDPNDPSDPDPTRFVSVSGLDSASQNGSPGQPWRSISYAIASISPTSSDPITISVGAGTYTGNLTLKPGTRVVGRTGAAVTISGTVAGAEGARLSNVIVSEPSGLASGTALLTLANVAMQVERVTFQGLAARTARGAVCNGDGPGEAVFSDCVFRSLGTGIAVYGAVPAVRRTLFDDIADVGLHIYASRGTKTTEGGSLGSAENPNSGWNTFQDMDGLAVDSERSGVILAQRNNWGTDDPAEIQALVSGDVDTGYPLPKNSSLVPSSIICLVLDDTTSTPVATASVQLAPGDFAPVTENVNGAYGFLCLTSGSYTATVTATNYQTQGRSITVGEGEQGTLTVRLVAGTNPPNPGGCGGSKALLSPAAEDSIPASLEVSPTSSIEPRSPIALRVPSAAGMKADSLWAKASDGSILPASWRPSDDGEGWIVVTPPDSGRWAAGPLALTVGGTKGDGTAITPLVRHFDVASHAGSATTRLALEPRLKPIPSPMGEAVTPVYRVASARVYEQPVTVSIPLARNANADDLELLYFAESGPHGGWYSGEKVKGWLADSPKRVVQTSAGPRLEFAVNYGAAVQVVQRSQLQAGGVALADASASGSGARWLSFAGCLLVLSAALGCLARRRA